MVFKRRDKLHWVENLRAYILPRTGWKRTLTYMAHRLKRLPDTPERIALGLAFGVFTSWSPFFLCPEARQLDAGAGPGRA